MDPLKFVKNNTYGINNLKIPQFLVSNINLEIYSLLNKLHNNLKRTSGVMTLKLYLKLF